MKVKKEFGDDEFFYEREVTVELDGDFSNDWEEFLDDKNNDGEDDNVGISDDKTETSSSQTEVLDDIYDDTTGEFEEYDEATLDAKIADIANAFADFDFDFDDTLPSQDGKIEEALKMNAKKEDDEKKQRVVESLASKNLPFDEDITSAEGLFPD